MHWGDRFLKGGVNTLTLPAFDPLSKQPELKHSGVRLEPVHLPWQLFALIEGDVQRHFETLRPLCEAFSYVSLSLAGRERPALLIRAASAVSAGSATAERDRSMPGAQRRPGTGLRRPSARHRQAGADREWPDHCDSPGRRNPCPALAAKPVAGRSRRRTTAALAARAAERTTGQARRATVCATKPCATARTSAKTRSAPASAEAWTCRD